ncbi:MAG TPA: hypothetical protein VIG90_08265 [Pedomonas sp.]|uniref:hypothetical protein n=1 Tax=Pedomonas sp. TaxID=2976421 RepID=UPI002F3FC055
MTKLIRIGVWGIERLLEILFCNLVAPVAFALFSGRGSVPYDPAILSQLTVEEILEAAEGWLHATLFAYLISGYIFATLWFGLVARPERICRQCTVMATSVVACYGITCVLFGMEMFLPIGVVLFMAGAVAYSTFIGGRLLDRWLEKVAHDKISQPGQISAHGG